MLWLILQILLCLSVAGLLGLLLGWLVWGRRARSEPAGWADTAALDASNARILELERDLAACRAKASASSTVAPSPPVAASASFAPPASPPAGAYGLFGPAAETPIDDLKVISGIGPVIEKQLAGIGITTYRQIAHLDADDILRVQEAIDFFPGRIEREGWVEQGGRLHREKYGTAP